MNIAFAACSEENSLNSLYLQHLQKVSAELFNKGHQVYIFMNSGPLLSETVFPSGVEIVEIEFQDAPFEEKYYSRAQAISDQFLLAFESFITTTRLDVLEFPLWSGLGFSTIRSKRLSVAFDQTKIITNVIFSHALWEEMDSAFFPTLESELVMEMESYILRNSDILCSPFEFIGEKIRAKFGRTDLKYYDPTLIKSLLSENKKNDKSAMILRSQLSESKSNFIPITIEAVFELSPRKHYRSSQMRSLVSVLIPYPCSQSCLDGLERLSSNEQGVAVELLYFAENGEAFDSFHPTVGSKIELDDMTPKWEALLGRCSGDYVVFASEHYCLTQEHLSAAVVAFLRNPDLAYIGSYLGISGKYPIGYVPSLMPFFNTCANVGNLFRKRSILQAISEQSISLQSVLEWDLIIALQQRYMMGDLIPDASLSITGSNDDSCLKSTRIETIKERLLRDEKTWKNHAFRIIKLVVSNPELIGVVAESSPADKISDWEFRLPKRELPQMLPPESVVSTEREDENEASVELDTNSIVAGQESLVGKISDDEPKSDDEVSVIEAKQGSSEVTAIEGSEEIDDALDWIQLFWAKDKVFSESDSIAKSYVQAEQLYLELSIQASTSVNFIRLDPSNRKGTVTLRRIQIVDNESNLAVFISSEENAFDNIVPTGDFEVEGIELDALMLKSIGSDPQIMINLKDSYLTDFTLSIEFGFKRS